MTVSDSVGPNDWGRFIRFAIRMLVATIYMKSWAPWTRTMITCGTLAVIYLFVKVVPVWLGVTT